MIFFIGKKKKKLFVTVQPCGRDCSTVHYWNAKEMKQIISLWQPPSTCRFFVRLSVVAHDMSPVWIKVYIHEKQW